MTPAVALALLLSPASARAECAVEAGLRFSYPSEETLQVPLNAVFWAVPAYGRVSFRLDGVELQPLDESDEGRFQFAPPQTLSPGMHDVEIAVSGMLQGEELEGEIRQFRVEAVEQPRVEADATIDAVEYYPATDDDVGDPRREGTAEECFELARLDLVCNDVIPESLTRIDFSAQGDAIAFLLEGAVLPASCRTYFPYEYSAGERAPYEIRPILPTGLAAARVFEGEIPLPASAPAQADADEGSSQAAGSCSIHLPPSGSSAPAFLWYAAAGVVALRLRRR